MWHNLDIRRLCLNVFNGTGASLVLTLGPFILVIDALTTMI